MHRQKRITFIVLIVAVTMLFGCGFPHQDQSAKPQATAIADPLPSWNDGAVKDAVIDFVARTTKEGSADFVPVSERIACFDNDGTLWSEQPMYFQVAFIAYRIKALAPLHPEWKNIQPFKAAMEGDMKTALAGGNQAYSDLLMATHTGMTTDEFERMIKDWLANDRHPVSHRPYTDMVFQPMLELLSYLRANGFKTFVVSAGTLEFMRPWMEAVYGIPPEQVVGTSLKEAYEMHEGVPAIMILPEMNFHNDRANKPIGIQQYIGRKPIFAGGNSDGDYEMLQWTTTSTGYPRFGMLVHHTDSVREWSYDRESSIGRLNKGLDSAARYHWQIVDMKNDWNVIYPFDKK